MDILRVIFILIPMILALTVHEYSHAWVAARLGDDTARMQGRMTLNPISHIDPIGTLLIPAVGMLSGFPFFGWAKPVPINPVQFTRRFRMKTGVLLCSIAGPLSNLIFAFVMVAVLAIIGPSTLIEILSNPKGIRFALILLALFTVKINIVLFLFNLLPIPPLDGSKVLAGFLPDRAYPIMDVINRYSFVLFILLLVAGGRFLAYPVDWISGLFDAIIGMPLLTGF